MIRSGEHALFDAYMKTGPARAHLSAMAAHAARIFATFHASTSALRASLARAQRSLDRLARSLEGSR